MANVPLPRMTKRWNVAAAASAVFGFVLGYVGTAGAPFCGSMGTCLKLVVDRGLAGFAPRAVVTGAMGALLFAAAVYVVFLLVSGIRTRLHDRSRTPSDRIESPARPAVEATPRPGMQWRRPSPLVVALSAAAIWAILSVGPSTWLEDANSLIPKDTVTTPSCGFGSSEAGNRCSRPGPAYTGSDFNEFFKPVAPIVTDRSCPGSNLLNINAPAPESDGMCHERSGGAIEPLMDDLVAGGKSGLLAFLAIGAALVLWPKLRAPSLPAG